jgi:hypothetical protein
VKHMRRIAVFAMSVMFLAIMGCGGGSSDQSGTLALTVTPTSLNASATGSAVANYKPANSSKNPVGLVISFTTDRPDVVALSSTSQGVGSDGTAAISFTAVSVPVDTTVKIIAQTGGLSQFQQIVIKAMAGSTGVVPPPVSATPSSIAFISASPTSITLKGTGGAGRVESSIVTFETRDAAGKALPGQTVDFSLNTTVGGLSITPVSAVSDTSGRAQTIVNAGVVSTPVRVTATIRGTSITVASDQLTITTGLPDFDSFSLASTNPNSESYDLDGVVVPITVNLADHFNNPVPDGTVVNFTTNAGKIFGSGPSVNGVVTVNWTSQQPRIITNPAGSTRSMIGRCIIMAYTVGEESFTDLNGNGLADPGEFTDTPEAFRDDNSNGARDPSEPFIDYNSDGLYNTPDGKYNGLLQGAAFIGAPRTKHVFANIETVMSTDSPIIYIFDVSSQISDGAGGQIPNPNLQQISDFNNAVLLGSLTRPLMPPLLTFIDQAKSLLIIVTDVHGNTMASGTKIAVATDIGKLFGGTATTVFKNNGYGEVLMPSLGQTTSPKFGSGTLTVAVTNAKGAVYTAYVPVSGFF